MKKCKIIHINDGSPETLTNGDRHFAEEFTWAENLINEYLEDGYTVKQMIPTVMPNILEAGNFSFYASGFTVYLEKDC